MKSSNSEGDRQGGPEQPILVATGLKYRGVTGRLTARLVPGGVDQVDGREWVLIGPGGGPYGRYEVEDSSSYADKVVIKFRGVDSEAQARPLVGQSIFLPCNGLVDLPEGTYYIFELIGSRVFTRDDREIGTVLGVRETGGTPLLVIAPRQSAGSSGQPEEILVPAARSICTRIDKQSGRITIDPPEGLMELYGL